MALSRSSSPSLFVPLVLAMPSFQAHHTPEKPELQRRSTKKVRQLKRIDMDKLEIDSAKRRGSLKRGCRMYEAAMAELRRADTASKQR